MYISLSFHASNKARVGNFSRISSPLSFVFRFQSQSQWNLGAMKLMDEFVTYQPK